MRLRTLLQDAGFEIRSIERYAAGLWVGSSPADVLNWFARIPEGRILETLGSHARQKFLGALRIELEHRTRADGVYLSGTAWVSTAANASLQWTLLRSWPLPEVAPRSRRTGAEQPSTWPRTSRQDVSPAASRSGRESSAARIAAIS